MATELTIALNAKTDKIHLSNPKNPGEHIPCRYVGIIEDEILPFTKDVLRPVLVDGIKPPENLTGLLMNGEPAKGDDSWEMGGILHFDTDRMFCRDSKYMALYHELSGVTREDFDPAFGRAYFLSTAIYYDLLQERKPYMLLTEAFIDPPAKGNGKTDSGADLERFLNALNNGKAGRLDMTVHGQLVSYEQGFPIGRNFNMAFKSDKAGFARKGWKKVLAYASKYMEKAKQKEFVSAFLALGGAIEIYDKTLKAAAKCKLGERQRVQCAKVPYSFVLRRAKELERD